MVMSPTQQVSKSQGGATQLPVEPDAEIVQGGLGGQPGLKALQLVRALPVQPEGMVELLKDVSTIWRIPASQQRSALGQGVLLLALGGEISRAP